MGEETLGLRSLGAEAVLGDSAMSFWLRGRSLGEGKMFLKREKERKKEEGKEQERSAVGA